jgi:hypothetical protein
VQHSPSRPMLLTNRELTQFGLTGVVEDTLRRGGLTIAARFEEIPPDSSVHVINVAGRLPRGSGFSSATTRTTSWSTWGTTS